MTFSNDIADDGYNEMIHTMGSLNSELSEVTPVPQGVEHDDDEKKEDFDIQDASPKARAQSKTPLMDLVDPKGTGKWVDIENVNVEELKSSVLKTSKVLATDAL